MMTAVYDKIGKTYDYTRKADPMITKKIIQFLAPIKGGSYLDIGCGSGNYTQAIFENGINICGIDISEEMLAKARRKSTQIKWIQGDARKLAFSNNLFNGATCILATHHIKDIEVFFQEAFRVLDKGYFVIFTSFPEQMKNYWLHRYFPKMMHKASNVMHSFERIFNALVSAGFENVRTDRFFVSNDLQDCFLQAGKYRPHIYLDPTVRSGISTFALEENQEEISYGSEQLQNDISTGQIYNIIKDHESDLGDYVFVIGSKR